MEQRSVLSRRAAACAASETLAVAARAKELKARGVDVIAFAAGEPDFDTPEYIRRAAHEAIDRGLTRYTPASGTPELRKAISEKLKSDNGLEYAPEDVVVSSGAKHSIANACLALVDDGDEVLLPAPYWVSYPEIVKLAGGRVKLLPTTPGSGYKVTAKEVADAAGPRTKLFILNSPSNPTGSVYSPDEIAGIAEVLVKRGVWCLSDEIYEKLIYGGERHVSIAATSPGMKARTIVVNGHSKSYAMTGWRIGYAAGPKDVMKAMGNIQSQTTSNPCSISQAAATAALVDGASERAEVERMRAEFERRRDRMAELLRGIPGVELPVVPGGAFYVFPDVSALYGRGRLASVKSSGDFAKLCIEEAHVALVAGGAFGADSCVRLSYATSVARIEDGVARLKKLVG